MNDSILNCIKKMLGISPDYEAFDQEIQVHINSVLMILRQLGVVTGSTKSISGPNETWHDVLGNNYSGDLEGVKTYVYLKVKGVFDPSASSSVTEAMNSMASELEWRIYSEAEFKEDK